MQPRKTIMTPRNFIIAYLYARGGRAGLDEIRRAYKEAEAAGLARPATRAELEKWIRWHQASGIVEARNGTLVLDRELPEWVRRRLDEEKSLISGNTARPG